MEIMIVEDLSSLFHCRNSNIFDKKYCFKGRKNLANLDEIWNNKDLEVFDIFTIF